MLRISRALCLGLAMLIPACSSKQSNTKQSPISKGPVSKQSGSLQFESIKNSGISLPVTKEQLLVKAAKSLREKDFATASTLAELAEDKFFDATDTDHNGELSEQEINAIPPSTTSRTPPPPGAGSPSMTGSARLEDVLGSPGTTAVPASTGPPLEKIVYTTTPLRIKSYMNEGEYLYNVRSVLRKNRAEGIIPNQLFEFKAFQLNDLQTVKVFKGGEEEGSLLHIVVFPKGNPSGSLVEEYTMPMSYVKSLAEADGKPFITVPGIYTGAEKANAKLQVGPSRDKDNDEFLKWLFVERLHGNLDGLKEIPGCMYKKGNGIKGLIDAEFVRLNND